MLPSNKFGGTYPPQGIFALQKSLRAGCDWGRGASSQRGESPAQRNFQRKFALRRVGSAKFVVPPTTERSKVRSTPNRYNRLYRAARVPEGPRPSVSEGVQRKPFPRVSFGQFLRGGSTPRFFAQLRSVGSKKDQLAGLCQNLPWSPDHRSGSKKYLDLFTNYL